MDNGENSPSVEVLGEGQAVQIVNFKALPSGSQLVLEKAAFREILNAVGERPVFLLSIAGASRQGKSFLMNVIRHYLEECSKGNGDPWDAIVKKETLSGFHIENKNIRDTIGFWMWSKPFIFKQSSGKEVAILLMDTQGVFDKYSTKKDWSMIVGLSLLTSSCVIYNLLNNLLEDNLGVLNNFVEFGVQTLKADNSSAFHKLLFLIRDWGFPNDNAYGAIGGSQFLNTNLKVEPGMPNDVKIVRETLRSVFEEIECFLMPNPGKAVQQNDYAGSLSHLDEEFLKILKDFLINLFVIDDLRPLCIGGQQVAGKDLLTYFAKYIELFNKQPAPTSQSLYDVTSELAQNQIKQEYVSKVIQKLESSMVKQGFLTGTQLQKEYKVACAQALTTFKTNHQTLEPATLAKHSSILIEQLKKVRAQLSASNSEHKTKYIAKLRESCESSFTTKLETMSNGVAWKFSDFEEILLRCKNDVMQQLSLGDRDKDFFEDVIPEIDSCINELCEVFRMNNSDSLKTIECDYRRKIDSLLRQYDINMQAMIPDGNEMVTVSRDKLMKYHSKCEIGILEEFNKSTTFDNDNLKDEANNELKGKITLKFSKILEEFQRTSKASACQAMNLVTAAVENYSSLMTDYIRTQGNPSEQELANQHKILKSEAKEIMIQIFHIVQDPIVAEQIKTTLDDKMDEAFVDLKRQLDGARQHYCSNWSSEVQTITSNYEASLRTFLEKLPNAEQNEFLEQEKQIRKVVDDALEKSDWVLPEDKGRFCQQIFNKLAGIEKAVEQDYFERLNALEIKCSESIKKYTEEFEENLIQIVQQHDHKLTVQKLQDIGSDKSGVVKRQFESDWVTNLPKSVLSKLVNQLVSEMKKIVSTVSREIETKHNESITEIETIVNDCVDDYTINLEEKLDGKLDISKLVRFHKSEKLKAEREFQKQTKQFKDFPKTTEMLQMLQNKIDAAYKTQSDKIQDYLQNAEIEMANVRQATKDTYCRYLTMRRNGIRSENELKVIHVKAMDVANEYLRESIENNEGICEISVEKLNKELKLMKSALEKEFENQKEEWLSCNKKIVDEQIKRVIQNTMKEYVERMTETMNQFDFVSDSSIQEIHAELLKKGTEQIKTSTGALNVYPVVYETQLAEDLNGLKTGYTNQNQINRRASETKMKNKVSQLTQEYSQWLESENNPQVKWDEKRNMYLQKIQESCAEMRLQDESYEEFLSSYTNELVIELDTIQQEWESLEPFAERLEVAVIRSKEVYEHEMSNMITPESPLLHTKILERYHNEAARKAWKEFQGRVKQTEAAKKRFEEVLKMAFRRYQDENDLKAAEAGEIAVGIDLGTTYSCVSVYRNNTVEIIPDRNNHSCIIPSYVLFESKEKFVVGHSAKEQSVICPETTVFDSKRLIGRRYHDQQVQDDIKLWPFRVIEDNNRPKVALHDDSFFPEEISGKILSQLKENAELHLGHVINKAVITVPAYFSDAQKRATRAAAQFAGLEVLELLSEPTSAAIAYKFHYNDDVSRNIFVYDLGGGTFDVSILNCKQGEMVVKGVSGNNHLGGQDFDNAMVKYCIEQFNKEYNINFDDEPCQRIKDSAIRRIRNKCEAMKINLSKCDSVRVIVDCLYKDKDMNVTITRDAFNQMIEEMLQETITLCRRALEEAKLSPADINDVVLVGGSSRIPKVQELLKELFDRGVLKMALNPDEVVAKGAAYRAAMLSGAKLRELGNIKFNNVTPFSLGIQVRGERFSVIIPRNTVVPCRKTEEYCTSADFQTKIRLQIYEGEDEVSVKNNLLGEFNLTGIPSAEKGEEEIDVTMDLNEEGLLHVTAVCRSTGGSKDIQIDTIRAGLSQEEIESQKARHNS